MFVSIFFSLRHTTAYNDIVLKHVDNYNMSVNSIDKNIFRLDKKSNMYYFAVLDKVVI